MGGLARAVGKGVESGILLVVVGAGRGLGLEERVSVGTRRELHESWTANVETAER
jgi:hypothetical protein